MTTTKLPLVGMIKVFKNGIALLWVQLHRLRVCVCVSCVCVCVCVWCVCVCVGMMMMIMMMMMMMMIIIIIIIIIIIRCYLLDSMRPWRFCIFFFFNVVNIIIVTRDELL